MFPEELPKRLIKMFSFVGNTFLAPFLGGGTAIFKDPVRFDKKIDPKN